MIRRNCVISWPLKRPGTSHYGCIVYTALTCIIALNYFELISGVHQPIPTSPLVHTNYHLRNTAADSKEGNLHENGGFCLTFSADFKTECSRHTHRRFPFFSVHPLREQNLRKTPQMLKIPCKLHLRFTYFLPWFSFFTKTMSLCRTQNFVPHQLGQ